MRLTILSSYLAATPLHRSADHRSVTAHPRMKTLSNCKSFMFRRRVYTTYLKMGADTVVSDVRVRNERADSIEYRHASWNWFGPAVVDHFLLSLLSVILWYLWEDRDSGCSTPARLIIDSFGIIQHQPKHHNSVSALALTHVIRMKNKTPAVHKSPSALFQTGRQLHADDFRLWCLSRLLCVLVKILRGFERSSEWKVHV